MATRKAVFLGTVSMGGRTYEAGEHWVRPQDMRALIDTGAVRWAGEQAKSTMPTKPNIWALTVPKAISAINLEKSDGRLRRWHKEERANPRKRGARKGVLNAIEEQLGQLGVSDPMPTLAR